MAEAKVVMLKPEMIAKADELLDSIDPKLVPIIGFSKLKEAIAYTGIVDELNAEQLVAKCTEIIDKCNDYAKVSKAFALEAKRKKDLQYQRAFIDSKADAEGVKLTVDARKALAETNTTVIKCQQLENAWTVLSAYFDTLHDDMKDRFYWFKRIFEYQKKMYGNTGGACGT